MPHHGRGAQKAPRSRHVKVGVNLKTPLGGYVPWGSPENILFAKLIKSSLVKRVSASLRNSVMVFL